MVSELKKFARIEEFDDLGQVLLIAKQCDDRPDYFAIEITFDPEIDVLESSCVRISGIDGKQAARELLGLITRDAVHSIVSEAKATTQEVVSGQ